MRKDWFNILPKLLKGAVFFNLKCLVTIATTQQNIHIGHSGTSKGGWLDLFLHWKKKDPWDIPCIEEMLRTISGVFNGIRTHELCDTSAPASLRSWVWILLKTHGIFQVPIWDNCWRLSSKCENRFINSLTTLHKNISFTQDISWKVEIIVITKQPCTCKVYW